MGANTSTSAPARLDAVDLLRGAVMVNMAIDHVRDYFGARDLLAPTNPATTTPVSVKRPRWN